MQIKVFNVKNEIGDLKESKLFGSITLFQKGMLVPIRGLSNVLYFKFVIVKWSLRADTKILRLDISLSRSQFKITKTCRIGPVLTYIICPDYYTIIFI